jgi:hypothetical protein
MSEIDGSGKPEPPEGTLYEVWIPRRAGNACFVAFAQGPSTGDARASVYNHALGASLRKRTT